MRPESEIGSAKFPTLEMRLASRSFLQRGSMSSEMEGARDVRSQGTVLVVEDELLVRMDLAELLRSDGYRVAEAGSADEAIATFERLGDIALVCTDVQMPGELDGVGLARWLRREHPSIPIIIISGEVTTRRSTRIADAIFDKPVSHDGLLLIVEKLLRSGTQPSDL